VPNNEPLVAEVWVTNLDAGFVVPKQTVKLKLVAFPFQQYGMLDGIVGHVGADASDRSNDNNNLTKPNELDKSQGGQAPTFYRTLIELGSDHLVTQAKQFNLTPGMQVSAEINLGTRTVIQYLLSPIQKTIHEAWRER